MILATDFATPETNIPIKAGQIRHLCLTFEPWFKGDA
jgi:hypothetical protein